LDLQLCFTRSVRSHYPQWVSVFVRLAAYFFIAGFSAFLLSSAFDEDRMRWLFVHTGYYFILCIFFVWAVTSVRLLRSENFSISSFFQKYWRGLLLALLMTAAVFFSVQSRFRVLSDETNLLSVAQSMSIDRTTFNAWMSKWTYGNFNIIESSPPFRPLLFPFLVSVLHSIFGIHYENAFALNFILLFILLAWAYIVCRQFFDEWISCSSIFLLLCSPILSISATSAGFDLCALVFCFLGMTSVYAFMKRPTSQRFGFMLMTLLTLSQTRYESAVFFPAVLIALYALKYFKLKDISGWLPVTLLAIIPIFWQRDIMRHHFENPPDIPPLSFGHLIQHLPDFVSSHFDFRFHLPLPTLMLLLGWLLLGSIAAMILQKKVFTSHYQKQYWALTCSLFLFLNGIYLSHHFGVIDHPTQTRYFLLYTTCICLVPLLWRFIWPHAIPREAFLALSLVAFLLYHPIAIQNRFMNSNNLPRVTHQVLGFLKSYDPRTLLVIANPPGIYTGTGYGAVNHAYAIDHSEQLLGQYSRFLFKVILVIQEIRYSDGKANDGQELDRAFNLTPLQETEGDGETFLRISKVNRPLRPFSFIGGKP
jgi:hypothetical protein